MYKKITSHGSINIPVALRRELGLEAKDPMEVDTDQEGNIILRPYLPRCIFCKGNEDIRMVFGHYACTGCIRRAYELLKGEAEDHG